MEMSRSTGEGNTAYLNNGNHKTELREKHVAVIMEAERWKQSN